MTEYVQRGDEPGRAAQGARARARRGAVVGFALTTLQRRLASSPEAIYQSLRRRRERLEKRVAEERIRKRGAEVAAELGDAELPAEFRDIDETSTPTTCPTASSRSSKRSSSTRRPPPGPSPSSSTRSRRSPSWRSSPARCAHSGTDRKWEELSSLLQHTPEMFDASGSRRKLIIFTEHRDTLNYLVGKLRGAARPRTRRW